MRYLEMRNMPLQYIKGTTRGLPLCGLCPRTQSSGSNKPDLPALPMNGLRASRRLGCLFFALMGAGLAACGGTDGATNVAPSGPTPCDVYCGLMAINCTRGFIQYADNDDCLTQCQGFALSANPNVWTGDTLQCRMVYALSAEQPERKQAFCSNAGPTGGDNCLP
jgi:hypothetical protein